MKNAAVLLDSSAWIEIFSQGQLVRVCEKERKSAKQIIVPTLCLFEVYRKIVAKTSEDKGLIAVAAMSQYHVSDLSREVALTAADLSLSLKLAMADSIILAHARTAKVRLITLDNDFAGIDGVTVLR